LENETTKQRIQLYVNNDVYVTLKRLCHGRTMNDFLVNCIKKGVEVLEPDLVLNMNVKTLINKQYYAREQTKLILKKITWVSNVKGMLKNLKMQGVTDTDLLNELIPQLKIEGKILGADVTFLKDLVHEETIPYKIIEKDLIVLTMNI